MAFVVRTEGARPQGDQGGVGRAVKCWQEEEEGKGGGLAG